MNFKVTILGSSSASPTINRFQTAHAINIHERFFLIDCGEGAQTQMIRNNINFARINHIFITHLHGDHIFGLYGLLSTLSLYNRTHELHIYGFSMLEYILNDFLKYFGNEFKYEIIFHAVNVRQNKVIYEDKNITVETIPLKHRVPCCGYLFKEKVPKLNIRKEMIERYKLSLSEITQIKEGCDLICEDGSIIPNEKLAYRPYIPRSYAFCSDTKYSKKIADIVKNVDLLYHEATFASESLKMAKQTGHSTTVQAAETAKQAKVKKLIIGHFSSRYKDLSQLLNEARNVFPETYLAKENDVYEIKQERFKG
ncbi:MAG: ribonuclease Z [Prevotellaceae bacterium]|jgi:ribonuclease Z|nr:ribonuclease Z [Prevotellaceae bacterium]